MIDRLLRSTPSWVTKVWSERGRLPTYPHGRAGKNIDISLFFLTWESSYVYVGLEYKIEELTHPEREGWWRCLLGIVIHSWWAIWHSLYHIQRVITKHLAACNRWNSIKTSSNPIDTIIIWYNSSKTSQYSGTILWVTYNCLHCLLSGCFKFKTEH